MVFSINASRISMFFACPARYNFSLEWQRKPDYLADHLKRGLNVHAVQAGTPRPFDKLSAYFENQIVDDMNGAVTDYKWLGPAELVQRVEIGDDIVINRTIDRVGVFKRVPRIVDWKTSGRPWWVSSDGPRIVSPRASGWQAKCYLVPTSDPRVPLKKWPTKIEFVVSDGLGAVIHTYDSQPGDVQEIKNAVEIIRSAKSFPKVKGYGCQWCDFFEMCFQVGNWKRKYQPREDNYRETDE